MAQRQFRSDDTDSWKEGFGSGIDGALSTSGNVNDNAANEACSGTSGTKSVTLAGAGSFTDGDIVIIHQTTGTGVGNWELNKIASGAGGTALTMQYDLMNTYTNSGNSKAQMFEMRQYSSVAINSGHTISGQAWDGTNGGIYGFICKGAVTLDGQITEKGSDTTYSSSGGGGRKLPSNGGGFRGGSTDDAVNSFGGQGENTSGTYNSYSSSAAANGAGGGGGNGNYNVGGGGGHATAGSAGSGSDVTNGSAGAGGASYGSASLVSMIFGGGGGGATGIAGSSHSTGCNGGGIVFIIADTITISGPIDARGGGATASGRIGGGGGAGGSILLKGRVIDVGSSKCLATGGTTASTEGEDAGNGGTGRIHADYSVSITGTTSPTINATEDSTIVDVSETGKGTTFYFM